MSLVFLFRPFRSLVVCLVLGLALSSCFGGNDGEACRYNFGNFVPSFFRLSGTCGPPPDFEHVTLELGQHIRRNISGGRATTNVTNLGCELRVTHVENGDAIDGIVLPLEGPDVLEGWVTAERVDEQGQRVCRSEYYMVLTSFDRLNQEAKENL